MKFIGQKHCLAKVTNPWQWTLHASTLIQPVENAHQDEHAPTYAFTPFDKFSTHIDTNTQIGNFFQYIDSC